jgi:hypothetical protein
MNGAGAGKSRYTCHGVSWGLLLQPNHIISSQYIFLTRIGEQREKHGFRATFSTNGIWERIRFRQSGAQAAAAAWGAFVNVSLQEWIGGHRLIGHMEANALFPVPDSPRE